MFLLSMVAHTYNPSYAGSGAIGELRFKAGPRRLTEWLKW
jgi:hypothetical protein